jgi:Zn-finger nucleic acid-binding protein
MPLICPACKKIHLKAQVDPQTQLEIDICPKCYGIWFDSEELSKFFQSQTLKTKFLLPESAEPNQETAYVMTTYSRGCPRCRIALQERLFGDVTIDMCEKCDGIWLDDGELRRIINMYKKGHRSIKKVSKELSKGLTGKEERPSLSDVVDVFLAFLGKPPKD